MAGFLLFGPLSLLNNPQSRDRYSLETSMDGTDWGEPEAVVTQIASKLLDGDRADITRFGNRRVSLFIRINGSNHDALAEGERAIMAQVNAGRNTLCYRPGPEAAFSVFDVVYSTMRHVFRADEFATMQRVVAVTLVCLPGVRRATLTTFVATPVPTTPPTVTLIDNCDNPATWSAGSNTKSTLTGGIRATNTAELSQIIWTRTGLAVTVAAGEYIRVEWDSNSTARPPTLNVGKDNCNLVAQEYVSGTRFRSYYRADTSPISTVIISAVVLGGAQGVGYPASATLDLFDLSKVNQLPNNGSSRQRSFTVEMGGTMRANSDILVEGSAGDGLGDDILVYTSDLATISPPLRQFLFSSSTVSTTSPGAGGLLSGSWQDLNTGSSIYRIPLALLVPGAYALIARMISNTSNTRTVNWTASTHGVWATQITTAADVSGSVSVALNDEGKFYQLGVLSLPLADQSPESVNNLSITLSGSGGANNGLDDLYLCNLDTGALTWFSGLLVPKSPSRILLAAATLDNEGLPGWRGGTMGTAADDISIVTKAVSLGIHSLEPGAPSKIFVATPRVNGATVTVSQYDRFHSAVPVSA